MNKTLFIAHTGGQMKNVHPQTNESSNVQGKV